MAHWGWYWKVKKKHCPKRLCEQFTTIDSFAMFKNKITTELFMNEIALEIPDHKLTALLLSDRFHVEYDQGSYDIMITKQSCNYGGLRYFFNCPRCSQRMRKLYCKDGQFLCRKCLNLGYLTQRLRPSMRNFNMALKIEKKLLNKAGDLDAKPPWMKYKSYEKLKDRYFEYSEIKYTEALRTELLNQKVNY
jgi:hypothetical protein